MMTMTSNASFRIYLALHLSILATGTHATLEPNIGNPSSCGRQEEGSCPLENEETPSFSGSFDRGVSLVQRSASLRLQSAPVKAETAAKETAANTRNQAKVEHEKHEETETAANSKIENAVVNAANAAVNAVNAANGVNTANTAANVAVTTAPKKKPLTYAAKKGAFAQPKTECDGKAGAEKIELKQKIADVASCAQACHGNKACIYFSYFDKKKWCTLWSKCSFQPRKVHSDCQTYEMTDRVVEAGAEATAAPVGVTTPPPVFATTAAPLAMAQIGAVAPTHKPNLVGFKGCYAKRTGGAYDGWAGDWFGPDVDHHLGEGQGAVLCAGACMGGGGHGFLTKEQVGTLKYFSVLQSGTQDCFCDKDVSKYETELPTGAGVKGYCVYELESYDPQKVRETFEAAKELAHDGGDANGNFYMPRYDYKMEYTGLWGECHVREYDYDYYSWDGKADLREYPWSTAVSRADCREKGLKR